VSHIVFPIFWASGLLAFAGIMAVTGRLLLAARGYRTIELPRQIEAAALAPIQAAIGEGRGD
jgi:hypothetical protein